MPKFFVADGNINEEEINIRGKDVNHIKNVLSKKIGDSIIICNPDTLIDYWCKIEEIKEQIIRCKIIEPLETNTESNIKVTIMQGLPKADKMELIIQKAVELGVYDIIPIEMKRCVVHLKEQDKKKKLERWQKIAEVGAKQSGRNRIPVIQEISTMENICHICQEYDIVIVAYEKEKENKLKYELKKLKEKSKKEWKIAVVIGPEGGIDKEEIEHLTKNGSKTVTLGNRILRTETVALTILSIIMYEFENN